MIQIRTRKLKKALTALLITYVALVTLLFIFQRKLQYIPMGAVGFPADYHLDNFEAIQLKAADDVKILAWYKKPKIGKKIILHFHGNAGNLGDRSLKFRRFSDNEFGVLAVTYRGYSGSEGYPTESGLMLDGDAALKFLLDEGYQLSDIIIFGESLGSGIAIPLAAKNKFYAVILEAPFASAASVAQKTYWFVPVKFLLRDKFDSLSVASEVTSPVLVFHKTRDKIVPYSEGEELFGATGSARKKFVTVQGVGHIDFDNEFLVDEMQEFLKEIRG